MSPEEETALRASIETQGVIYPIVVDQTGRILDGYNRKRIADELGVEYKTEVRHVDSDEQAHDIAVEVNAARRHLNERGMRALIIEETQRKPEESARALARRLGCTHPTVVAVRRQLANGIKPQWIIEGVTRSPHARSSPLEKFSTSEPVDIIPGAAMILDPATGEPGLIEDRAMWSRKFREAFRQKVADQPADEAASKENVSRAEWAAAQQVNFGAAVEFAHGLHTVIDGGWLDKDTPDGLRRLLWDLHAAIEDRVPRPDEDAAD
jgi:hypothetical protein